MCLSLAASGSVSDQCLCSFSLNVSGSDGGFVSRCVVVVRECV